MSATIVVPSIVASYTAACLASMRFAERPDTGLLVIYNTPEQNHGVAGSWNLGARQMYQDQHDWLVICSAAVRFGILGGLDLLDALDNPPDFPHDIPVIEAGNGLGWHLIAFHREVFLRVGYFDENYWPAYMEDLDYSHRIQLAYGVDSRAPGFQGPLWPKVDVNARLAETAHGIKHGGVTVDLAALERYHIAKWGGGAQQERFTSPYDSGNPVSFWRTPVRT